METIAVASSPPLAERSTKLAAPGTSSMRAKADALKKAGVHVISFAAGELPFDAYPEMRRGAERAVEEQRNRYTPTLGLDLLRTAIANDVSVRCGTRYTAENIAVTAGAKQALFNAALMVLNEGDEAIIPAPYWETFGAQVRLADAVPVFVDTSPDLYQLKAHRIEKALSSNTKMIVLNTPNNPTGRVYDKEELAAICKLALDKNIWVLFDECYRDFVRWPSSHHNIVSLCPEIKEQAILINSFSKSHAVTGWRAGYACAPARLISAMSRLQGHTTSNASSLAQYGALAALEAQGDEYHNGINDFLDGQLRIALEYIDGIDCLTYAPPEGAFYLYLNVSGVIGRRYEGALIRDCNHLVELLLIEAHIAVVGASAGGDPYGVRMTYCVDRDELRLGMERLTRFMQAVV